MQCNSQNSRDQLEVSLDKPVHKDPHRDVCGVHHSVPRGWSVNAQEHQFIGQVGVQRALKDVGTAAHAVAMLLVWFVAVSTSELDTLLTLRCTPDGAASL